jgi:hypothetical protein
LRRAGRDRPHAQRHFDFFGECFRMATLSQSQIIESKPIGGGLDGFRAFFNSTYEDVGIPETSQVLVQVGNEGTLYISL